MILVTGATGYTGRFLIQKLLDQGRTVRLLVRASSDLSGIDAGAIETGVIQIVTGDLEQAGNSAAAFAGVRTVLHLAGMEHARALCDQLEGEVERVVVTSSLRRFSRIPSATVDKVVRGEQELIESGVPNTILRPSMIFGPGNDRNISRLAAQLRRSRFVPIFGNGRHLMQPVFVGDLVAAIVACLEEPATSGRAYAIAGADPLSYDELIDVVGTAVGCAPVKIHLPCWPALTAIWCADRLGLRLPVSSEQVHRLQEDKAFSIEAARADFGYSPLGFSEAIKQTYGSGSEQLPKKGALGYNSGQRW
jgi:nucleoside-diphosphate-sugar epimerase